MSDPEPELKTYACQTCGVEFESPTARKYCSPDCVGEMRSPSPPPAEIEKRKREILLTRGSGIWTETLD